MGGWYWSRLECAVLGHAVLCHVAGARSARCAVQTRCEYVHVRSSAASLRHRVFSSQRTLRAPAVVCNLLWSVMRVTGVRGDV